MDVSADLNELTRCSVGLVSAGVKSILDIGRYRFQCCPLSFLISLMVTRTLEYLVRISSSVMKAWYTTGYPMQETLGVPVLSYAKTNDFPAFYTARSGFKVSFLSPHSDCFGIEPASGALACQ
jgi:pseudouridine-5'-phosphate glycosidase/pseudouridine kinase